jgi:hypothetical protein
MDKNHPRGMKIEAVAAYLSLTTSGVHDWVRRELIPGTHRWDKKAIDAALDKRSGLAALNPSSAYDEWEAKQTAGQSALERWKA